MSASHHNLTNTSRSHRDKGVGVFNRKTGDKVENVLSSCLNDEVTFASRESCLWAW